MLSFVFKVSLNVQMGFGGTKGGGKQSKCSRYVLAQWLILDDELLGGGTLSLTI